MNMRSFLRHITNYAMVNHFHIALLVLRILVCIQLIVVHGYKKIGIGADIAEVVPNPFGFPQNLNQIFAIGANIGFPILVFFGFLTRLATLPILAVTLTGYLVVHAHDSLQERDIPFMYSIVFAYLLFVGAGKYSVDALIHKKLSL
ncbi:DoxX family protein [Mariniflexile gromovii]|uniref:DoxX family protein n=1 Tax=Mariniflexile gromovii TaxID=362523 RepID=A0ABS4BUN9_9FLAO|nr:DoxX family protein [Mariniflexile gromovii]MBP0904308.1 DoxX family protein [Mariniflexile gromovii]